MTRKALNRVRREVYEQLTRITASGPDTFWYTKGVMAGLALALERIEGIETELLAKQDEDDE